MSDARTSDDRDATDPFDAESSDEYGGDDASETGDGSRENVGGWFASTALRWALAVVGVVLLLFALGQAFDAPLLGWLVDAATSETGRWLVLALVALGLIALAANGPWDNWT